MSERKPILMQVLILAAGLALGTVFGFLVLAFFGVR